MYLQHYGFEREPFNITPDSRFLFISKRHSEAMAALMYGIEQRKGFIALTGEIGSGKTTICRALLRELDRETIRLALILNPQLSDVELLQAINAEYGLAHTSTSKRELLATLNEFLLEQYQSGRNCVLVIDESQRLSTDALEQVRLISNLELEATKLIQIALVGQPELDDLLHLPELEQLNQRITVRYHIDPLDFDELCEYIEHRLNVAEPKHAVVFNKKALGAVFEYTGGVPRKINVLCDRIMLIGFVAGIYEIEETHVRQAIAEVAGRRATKKGRLASTSSGAILPPRGSASPDESDDAVAVAGRPASSNLVLPISIVVGCGLLALGLAANAGVFGGKRRGDEDSQSIAQSRATPTATIAPSPTAIPTAVPVATPAPAAQGTPVPPPTSTPAVVVAVVQTPTPTPAPEMTPPPVATPVAAEWSYDGDGILRVMRPEYAYIAGVLTWISKTTDQKLGGADLEQLRSLDAARLSNYRLTEGQPPLHLREAKLAASLATLPPALLPALLQTDSRSTTFGPWTVLLSRENGTSTLADPIRGILRLPDAAVEEQLAGVVVPYSDPEGLTNLAPLDTGDRVTALQKRLARARLLEGEPSGVYDSATELALKKFRDRRSLPGDSVVDPVLALALIKETGS